MLYTAKAFHGLSSGALSLNGDQVGDHRLAPGWTDYDTRIQHQTFEVTDQLRAGENVLGGRLRV